MLLKPETLSDPARCPLPQDDGNVSDAPSASLRGAGGIMGARRRLLKRQEGEHMHARVTHRGPAE